MQKSNLEYGSYLQEMNDEIGLFWKAWYVDYSRQNHLGWSVHCAMFSSFLSNLPIGHCNAMARKLNRDWFHSRPARRTDLIHTCQKEKRDPKREPEWARENLFLALSLNLSLKLSLWLANNPLIFKPKQIMMQIYSCMLNIVGTNICC